MPQLTPAQWDTLREAVRDQVMRRAVSRFPELRITPIDLQALEAAKGWTALGRRVDWDWHRIVKRRPHGRVEAAFWYSGTLCGLTFGSTEETHVSLTRLEGSPLSEHPLKGHVTDLAIAVLEFQAFALGIPKTILPDPDPNLIGWYRSRGYEAVAEAGSIRYLVKERALI